MPGDWETCGTLDVPERECCESCHEDDELGYAEMLDYALKDGRLAVLCCGGRRNLVSRGLLDG